jgi:hypothetical protein
MEIKDALVEAQRHEGWSDEYVGALTGRTSTSVKRWKDGEAGMPGEAVVALQKASPRFRELTLGAAA